MKQIRNFFSSRWILIIPLLLMRIFVIVFLELCNYGIVNYPNIQIYMPSLLLLYCLIGIVFLPKIKEKKKALITAAIFEVVINMLILIGWLLAFVFDIIIYLPRLSNIFAYTQELLVDMWRQNPITYCVCLPFAEDLFLTGIVSTLLSPASVGFVYLFSKTPMLFKFLKRIRIKKSEKSITFYLKETETKK